MLNTYGGQVMGEEPRLARMASDTPTPSMKREKTNDTHRRSHSLVLLFSCIADMLNMNFGCKGRHIEFLIIYLHD